MYLGAFTVELKVEKIREPGDEAKIECLHVIDLLLLAIAKSEKRKACTTITELVVVWSLCSVCTSVTKSKVVILYNTSHFLL